MFGKQTEAPYPPFRTKPPYLLGQNPHLRFSWTITTFAFFLFNLSLQLILRIRQQDQSSKAIIIFVDFYPRSMTSMFHKQRLILTQKIRNSTVIFSLLSNLYGFPMALTSDTSVFKMPFCQCWNPCLYRCPWSTILCNKTTKISKM